MPTVRYYLRICLDGLRKISTSISHVSRCRVKVFTQRHLESKQYLIISSIKLISGQKSYFHTILELSSITRRVYGAKRGRLE